MNEILKLVLSLSLSGSLLMLALLLCKPLIKNRISKRWQYYIWLVVIARLLLPFTPETSPVGTLFHQVDRAIIWTDSAATPRQNMASAPQPGDDAAIKNNTAPKNEEADAAPTPQKFFTVLIQNLWLVWLVVALILIIRKITIYQSFVNYIRAGRVEVSDTAVLDRLALIGAQAGVKRPVELYTNALISSPLLLGFFRPCIVLPSTDLAPVDLEYTLLHELTHYKRRDMLYKWLVQLVICLHWFNPLVYAMSREVGRACELAVDEAVIKALDPQGRRAYGDTLLNAIGGGGHYRDTLASVTLNENKQLLKERLEAIMVYRKKTKLVVTISLVLTIMLACGATAIGAYAAPTSQFDMRKAQSITQEETNLIMGVTKKIQLGNEEPYKQVPPEDEAYSKWKIDKKDGVYYYKNERVRIFMDVRENNSFVNFNYDALGTVDLRLVRGHNGDIAKIEYLSPTEAEEIRADLDIAHSSLIEEAEDVSRLSKDMVPEKVLNVINSCDAETWYVVVENDYQYIYYNGVPHNYTWQPELRQDSATIQIFDMGKSAGTYVLLKVPANLKLTVYYNAEKLICDEIRVGSSQAKALETALT